MNTFDRFQLVVLRRYGWAVAALDFADDFPPITDEGEYWL